MTETVYSKAVVDDLARQLMEAQSMILGLIVGTNVHAGIWTEQEARYRLETMLATAEMGIAKTMFEDLLKHLESETGPFLQVIDGGKAD